MANDGASKIRAFFGKTIEEMFASGAGTGRIAFLMASYHAYLAGRDDRGRPFTVDEPALSAEERARLAVEHPLALFETAAFGDLFRRRTPAFCDAYVGLRKALAERGCNLLLDDVGG